MLSKKPILVLCHDFIPYYKSLGGVVRMVTLCDFLQRQGHSVFVLAKSGTFQSYHGYDSLVDKIHIQYLTHPMEPQNPKRSSSFTRPTLGSILTYRIKRIVKDLTRFFIIPDQGAWMVNKYYCAACSIIDKEHINHIIISSPPHSIQKVGLKLKNHYKEKINLVVDYRDSWNTRNHFTQKNKLKDFFCKRLEKRILLHADHFTFVTEPILEKIEKIYNISIRNKSLLVMNGFNPRLPTTSETSPLYSKIRIGHFGPISDNPKSFRDISVLFQVLNVSKELCAGIEFHFYGQSHIKAIRDLPKGVTNFHPSLTHVEALHEMQNMDFLLLVHTDTHDCDEILTGKFFDYISVKKPILCLTPRNMEATRWVEKFGIGIWMNAEDRDDITRKLGALNKETVQFDEAYSRFNVNDYSRDAQFAKMVPLFI